MGIRIAIIIERADVLLGGAERSVFELADALGEVGCDVEILAARAPENAPSVKALCSGSHGERTPLPVFAAAIGRYLRDNHFDVVHSTLPLGLADVYQPRGGTYAEAMRRNAASYGNPAKVLYKRLTAFTNMRRMRLLNAERRLCRGHKGPFIAALSQYVAGQFRRHYRVDEKRLVVIPNAVAAAGQADPHRADGLRRQILEGCGLKDADDPLLLLFVANNFRLKGLGPLVRALGMAKNHENGRRAYLVVAGRGRSGRYRKLAAKYDVSNRIVFLGSVRHISDILSVTDVAVLPTFYDPASRFTLEALAAGMPVITSSSNGAVDMFTSGRHGIVVDDPRNYAALADAINHYRIRRNLESAREAIMEDNLPQLVSIDNCAVAMVKLYERIISEKHK